jgi:hypothetical protein
VSNKHKTPTIPLPDVLRKLRDLLPNETPFTVGKFDDGTWTVDGYFDVWVELRDVKLEEFDQPTNERLRELLSHLLAGALNGELCVTTSMSVDTFGRLGTDGGVLLTDRVIKGLNLKAGEFVYFVKSSGGGFEVVSEARMHAELSEAPERIHLFDVDPDTLVGIAACDDGSPGWVVLQVREYNPGVSDQRGEPSEPIMTEIAPLSDAHGQIVWMDINDAVEVYQTGHVWKHDMGEGEP